jgi:hypothetical protein
LASHVGESSQTKNRSLARWDESREQQFLEWYRRVCAAEQGHRRRAGAYNRRHLWLGIPVVVFSTIVGTSVFASLQDSQVHYFGLRVAIGVVSVLAAVLSSLQTFLGYAQRSERHRIASLRYESLRRAMEPKLATPSGARGDANAALQDVRAKLDRYGKESPQIGVKMWSALEKEFGVQGVSIRLD